MKKRIEYGYKQMAARGAHAGMLAAALALMVGASLCEAGQATVDNGNIDIVINYHGSPAGNDDGSSEETPRSDQDVIESIIGHYADAVYESTETAHRLREVRIYRNGQVPQGISADIVWLNTLPDNNTRPGGDGPSAGPVANSHINMCDLWDEWNDDLLADESGAGYTLGHEMGHFMYGVYDEYVINQGDLVVVPAIMNSQWNARRENDPNFHDYRWLNFSIAADPDAGTDYENTLQTEQHRRMNASCWETLARDPANDPVLPRRWTLDGFRRQYADLAAVAPAAGAEPNVDLDEAGADPRRDLEVIWMTSNLVYQLVLDHSGSMSGSKLEDAKAGAKLLLGEMELGKTSVGIIKFDDDVTVVRSITELTTEAARNDLISAIDGITADGSTAIGDAAQRALDDIVAYGVRGDSRFVFLLSDGLSNTGRDPLSVVPDYVDNDVILYTFGYGTGADEDTLRQMAEDTTGEYRFAPTSLADIHEAFEDAYASSVPGVTLTSSSPSVPSGTTQEYPFYVDDTLVVLSATVLYEDGAVTATLSDPLASVVNPTRFVQAGGQTLAIFEINRPMSGSWKLLLDASTGTGGNTKVTIKGESDTVTYTLDASSVHGSTLAYPDELVIQALLHAGSHVSGANVQATVVQPNGVAVTVVLHDDGVSPDPLAGDGVYSAAFTYRHDGAHRVTVTADNTAGTAAFTGTGRMFSKPEFGDGLPAVADVPIGKNFQRSGSFQVQVSGAPQFINVTPYSSTDFATWQLDRNTGAMMGSMIVSNHTDSFKTLSEPFWYVLQESQNVRLYQVDGYTNGLPYTEITAKVNAALQTKYGRQTMQPGEWVTINEMRIWSRDRSIPELSALWALYADPPGEQPAKLHSYDFNRDRLIQDQEVLKGVKDWYHNDMDDFELLRLIELWKSRSE